MLKNILRKIVCLIAVLYYAESNYSVETCKEVTKTDLPHPCALSDHVDNLPNCSINNAIISSRVACTSNKQCCWNNQTNSCFARPKKCYVDLRPEKCISGLQTLGINGIYTGYSTNGSYCHVNRIVITGENRKLLGYENDVGFPISGSNSDHCNEWWIVQVKKSKNGGCEVQASPKRGNGPLKVVTGKMLFDKICVVKQNKHTYEFSFVPDGGNTTKCVCRVDAWIEAKEEDLPVSNGIKNYIRRKENQSTCTQVLGVIVRSSWRDRVSVLNRNEVMVVMNALSNLSNYQDLDGLSLYDVQVFLESTRKVAGYPFYEGLNQGLAQELMQKTTYVMNNLIQRLTNNFKIVKSATVKPTVGDQTTLSSLATSENDNNALNNSLEEAKLRRSLFQTMESMSEAVAAHLQPLANRTEFLLRTVESNVDLQLVIIKPDNITDLLNKEHTTKRKTEIDKISVIKFPDEELNFSEDSVALMSIFYEYQEPDLELGLINRVSDYVSVNVWKYVKGQAVSISVPVNFTLYRHAADRQFGQHRVPICSFLKFNQSQEEWSSYGCTTENTEEKTYCECNHTTHFAVLMKVEGTELSPEHNRILEIITFILGSLSISCLCVTALVFISYRKTLLKDRMLIHFHLIIALLGGYVALLVSSIFTSSEEEVISLPCLMSSAFIHFFFLGAFFWSLVEGLYLFYKIVMVFECKWGHCFPRYSPFLGWLFPFVIVATTFVISRTSVLTDSQHSHKDTYANSLTCFLRVDNNVIWSYVGPVLCIIVINILILMKVMYVIFKSSYTSSRFASSTESTRISESLKRSFRGALLLMPILGIPTIIAMLYNFYNDKDNISSSTGVAIGTMGAYLQVILAGIQGILIFLFYCVYNAEVRNAFALTAKRRKSAENLSSQVRQRTRSLLPLLFNRSDSVDEITQANERLQKHSFSFNSGTRTRRLTNASTNSRAAVTNYSIYGRRESHNV